MGASDLQTVKVRDVRRRPPLPNLNHQADPLVIMQVDVSDDHATERNGSAILRLFGVTEQGNSVLLRGHRFYHCLYVPVLPGDDASTLNEGLNVALSKKHDGMNHKIVVHVRVVTKRNIMYFVPGDSEMQFFRITILNPRYMKETASLLQSGGLRVETPDGMKPLPEIVTFESTLDYALRFMI
ncbi:DNA polymerase delta catalytic subunit [Gracilariopsis chorda]|uniref:DNA polymerase delta catalytic subunit n=1 Tax=Gracilariopsis chorda TaxID=448386 RepID=A0A2V3II90_9FLOR|nr:DNA polymerase delta catalytic subunit [Gracilariopsis chorda]|eukprot:PXF41806.1 DNA polymerase delta catalytic subunit [Gracilariopsis chorda]